ncbi:MAG: PEP-CTERM sorting domain-containing protein [Pirellulales bacterium]
MKISHLTAISLLCFLSFSSVGLTAVPTIETFDNDVAGWVGNTTSSVVVHGADGGNPGGHLLTRKDLSPPVFDIGALIDQADNPNFGGDYGAAGIVRVSVDLNFMTDNVDAAWVRFRTGSAVNGWLYPLTNVFPTDAWNTYSVDFNPLWTDQQAQDAGWLTDQDIDAGADPSPNFVSVLEDVDTAEVRIVSVGSTVVGIDNFGIFVPEPSSVLLLVLGALLLCSHGRLRSGKA